MKKLLRKRTMFLLTLLVGLCMPAMAQKDVSGADLQPYTTIYYLRNVATGLYLKYGGAWGTHAVEAVSAHPVIFEQNKQDDTYAISSIVGYLSSNNSVGAFMDRPITESRWMINEVSSASNRNYIVNEDGFALASYGNVAGQIDLREFDANDTRQQWEILTEEQIRPQAATALQIPMNLTSLIKASSFDLVDAFSMSDIHYGYYNYKYADDGKTKTDSTWVDGLKQPMYLTDINNPYYRDRWSAVDLNGKVLNGGYSWWSRWAWEDIFRSGEPTGYASSGVCENGVRSAFVFSQSVGQLPKGSYELSVEGFSRVLWEVDAGWLGTYHGSYDSPVYIEVVDASGNKLHSGEVRLLENTNIAANDAWHTAISEHKQVNGLSKGQYAAKEFKENDNWKQTVKFNLTQSTNVIVRLKRPQSLEQISTKLDLGFTEINIPLGSKAQCFVAFDNFTLVYNGTDSNPTPWGDIFYDKLKAAHDAALSNLQALKEYGFDGCEHMDVWRENLKVTFDEANGKASFNSDVVDTEKEFLEALANIEAAYQAALEEHRKHHLVLDQNSTTLPEINKEFKSVTVKRPVTANGYWTTFAVPFPISEDSISDWGWDVRELVSSRADAPDANGKQNITLTFGKVKAIEAAKPYMVKVEESMDEFVVKNVPVNTTTSTSRTIYGSDAAIDDVEFIGVYTMRFMPVGVYFVNKNNQYKRVVKENNNRIRGYRAYIKLLDDSGVARSLGYRWGDETGIDSANNDEVTIVGIYNLNGMRLEDMQEGVNILRMSDGSTMKVIIK